ncbi:ParB/RepB/Spo0J family partition protein [Glycocaulis profundi]|nr:ParB/RepB/Spo0J family partition protein [Glycocaulis profundi]
MTTHPNLSVADFQLIAALAVAQDGGADAPGWTELARELERDTSNVRRSTMKLVKAELITLDPLTVPAMTRALAAAFLPGESGEVAGATTGLATVPFEAIGPSPLNPRKSFDPDALDTLAASLAAKGMLQPILLRPAPDRPGKYEIAAGERRWRATGIRLERGEIEADWPVPAIVREMTDIELLEIAIAENRDRENVHPLEEAHAYAEIQRLREAAGDAPEKVTAELAERAGVTRRHIQKRIKLAKDLSDAAREAFAERRITLAQASAIAPYPHGTQNAALENILKGWNGWNTAEDIANTLRDQTGLSLAKAIFPPEAYDGPTTLDDEDQVVYLDRARCEALQRDALKGLAQKFRDEGWAEVVVSQDDSWRWGSQHGWDHPDGEKAKKTEARVVIGLHRDLSVGLRYCQLPPKAAAKAEAAAKAAQNGEAPPPPPPSLDYAKRHWLQAAADKTVRLQLALANAPARFTQAIAVLALTPRDDPWSAKGAHGWIHGHKIDGEDAKVPSPALKVLADLLADLDGFAASKQGVSCTDQVKALPALLASPVLDRIFAAAVAAQCGSWPGFNPRPGDDPLTVALASELGELVPDWTMSEDWLKAFTIPQLEKIADACIHPVVDGEGLLRGSTLMPKGKAAAVKFIVDHLRRDTDWTAPEMRFASAPKIEGAVHALMHPEASGPADA